MSNYVLNYDLAGNVVGATVDGVATFRGDDNRPWLDFLSSTPGVDVSLFPAPTPLEVTINQRALAKLLVASSGGGPSKLVRAVVLVAMDEINLLRDFDAQLKAAVAAASSLADLKARVAAIDTNLNQRTKAQLINAVGTKLDSGDPD